MVKLNYLLLFASVKCISEIYGYVLEVNPGLKEYYTMPENCKNKTYCFEKGEGYPDDYIVELMKNNYMKMEDEDNFGYRDGNAHVLSYRSECNSTKKDGPIYYVLDQFNRTRAVIQSNHEEYHFIQKYEVTYCDNEGPQQRTEHIHQSNLKESNLELRCENVYLELPFFVFSDEELDMEEVFAKIPVCCKCRYVKKM